MKSDSYLSNQWVRVRLTAEGSRLRVQVYRIDTRQWLNTDGEWSDSPDFALEKQDTAITGAGKAGIARAAQFSGAVAFDDFEAHAAGANVGPVVTVSPTSGSSPFSGDVAFRATVTGNPTRVEFRLNNVLRSVSAISPATWTLDTTTLTNGTYTLTVRAFDMAGNVGSTDYVFTTDNPGLGPIIDAEHSAALLAHSHRATRLQRQPDGYVRAEPVAELGRSGGPERRAICPTIQSVSPEYAATDLQQRLEPVSGVACRLAAIRGPVMASRANWRSTTSPRRPRSPERARRRNR